MRLAKCMYLLFSDGSEVQFTAVLHQILILNFPSQPDRRSQQTQDHLLSVPLFIYLPRPSQQKQYNECYAWFNYVNILNYIYNLTLEFIRYITYRK
jgi:hypothetical protein